MADLGKLISGFRVFKATTYAEHKDIIEHVVQQGIIPKTMVIACADLRMPIGMLFSANPGELYTISNMAALVPAYSPESVHGITAALEFATNVLEVENIIILGHAKCHSIKQILKDDQNSSKAMQSWFSIAAEARDAVRKQMYKNTPEERQAACEHESIVLSMRNLMTYPTVKRRMDEDRLNIYGWRFNIEEGSIMAFDPDTGYFEPLV